MNTFIRITANFIIAIGILIILGGLLSIFGVLNWLFNNFNQNLAPIDITLISFNTGWPITLGGLLIMGAGEFLVLMVNLAEYMKVIAQKALDR